ncbi:MAG: carboxypeptidase-like regulatory domain-containing protein [Flavobacteriales bacterium]|nr:carboxypeptidase-like regulatory domain-containing protein [Flavobacteriales bacterium]
MNRLFSKSLNKFVYSAILLTGFWVLTANSFYAYAQQVRFKGRLVETDSFSKIPFAVVGLKGKLDATITDETGYFELYCNLKDTLVVSHVGFQKLFRSVRNCYDSTKKVNAIYVARKNFDLVPVTITGKRLSKEKVEEYEKHLNRVKPNISSPISAIYESLSRRGKERTKMDEIYRGLLLRDQLEQRLPPRKLYLITNDKSVKLDDLLILCPVTNYFVLNASDYVFFYHFTQCWEEYRRLNKGG